MSKSDWENNSRIFPLYIEIGKGHDPSAGNRAYVNVETFDLCFLYLKYPRSQEGPITLKNKEFYSVYGVVGKAAGASVNIFEQPITRTFIGFLEDRLVREWLPRTWEKLNKA